MYVGVSHSVAPPQHAETDLIGFGSIMPFTLILKNIPDAVHERLKAAATAHRRSLSSEAIVCLKSALLPTKIASGERLARARDLQAALTPKRFRVHDIATLKKRGRA